MRITQKSVDLCAENVDRIDREDAVNCFDDIVRIKKVIDNFYNVNISPRVAYAFWRDYSDTLAAGWIILPKDDEELANQSCWSFKSFLDKTCAYAILNEDSKFDEFLNDENY